MVNGDMLEVAEFGDVLVPRYLSIGNQVPSLHSMFPGIHTSSGAGIASFCIGVPENSTGAPVDQKWQVACHSNAKLCNSCPGQCGNSGKHT